MRLAVYGSTLDNTPIRLLTHDFKRLVQTERLADSEFESIKIFTSMREKISVGSKSAIYAGTLPIGGRYFRLVFDKPAKSQDPPWMILSESAREEQPTPSLCH